MSIVTQSKGDIFDTTDTFTFKRQNQTRILMLEIKGVSASIMETVEDSNSLRYSRSLADLNYQDLDLEFSFAYPIEAHLIGILMIRIEIILTKILSRRNLYLTRGENTRYFTSELVASHITTKQFCVLNIIWSLNSFLVIYNI